MDRSAGVPHLSGHRHLRSGRPPKTPTSFVGAAIDLGINFVDTADVYGNTPALHRPGAPTAADREPAEQILGRATLPGRRDEMVIATKSNDIVGHNINDRGLSRRHIIRQVETSLRRLNTDDIDLDYAHDPDPDTPLDQTGPAYDDLIRQGKIRYVGLSNHPAWQVTQALVDRRPPPSADTRRHPG